MAYETFHTTGELIDILNKFPRDTKIVTRTSNFEKCGYEDKVFINTNLTKLSEQKYDTYDSFDGTPYSYKTLVLDKNGNIEALII